MAKKINALPPWSQLIYTLRKRKNMSQQALAEAVGATQSGVAKWENGSTKPVPEVLMALADVFRGEPESLGLMEHAGMPRDFLLGKTGLGMIPAIAAQRAIEDAQRLRMDELVASGLLRQGEGMLRDVPLLRDAAAAGTPRLIDDNAIERYVPMPAEWLPRGGTYYAVTVTGDSMEPMLLSGSVVIIDVDQTDAKELVNAMIAARDSDGVTIKFLREDDGDYMLVPMHVSVRHPVRRLKKGMSIIGKVVKWIGEPPRPPHQARRKGD